jgi:UDP-N-acetylmuramate dehydrogenase
MSAGPFGARTTLRVGGEAAEVIEVESLEHLVGLAGSWPQGQAFYVLGNGSNTLVADVGFDGVVLHLGDAFDEVVIEGTTLTAGGGADLPVIARRSVEAGLSGFEWAVGVPGTMGGAVAMNAGGHGSDLAASLREVTTLDLRTGELRTRSGAEMAFGYRSSALRSDEVVIAAVLDLIEADPEEGRAQLREIVRWRREHQPGGANCGSVFTNPPEDSAGRLIEAAGLRGSRHGTAEVSEKHANFIQADAQGSADDVLALMVEVVEAVEAASGVRLHSEVRLVGVDEDLRRRLGGST